MPVLLATLVLMTWLTGCSGTDPDNLRPWEKTDQSDGNTTHTKDYGPKLEEGKPYVVVKGDTLYSIAFRLGIDFRELAARNGIQSPYIIKVGQTLRTAKLAPQPSTKAPKVAVKAASTPKKQINRPRSSQK